MNPNEILEIVRELRDSKDASALWHLQSFTATELEDFAERLQIAVENQNAYDEHKLLRRWGSGPDFSHVESALKFLCTSGQSPNKHLLAAVRDFIGKEEKKRTEQFYLTNIGRQVWDTLDWCLEERRPCFIEGREGRGKSASARAWFEAHRGEARYVSLPGLGVQRDFFSALADAYGVNFSAAKAPNEIRWRVRDAIVRSGLVLIIDEAHHALPERQRAVRPALIDWIDCDLCNAGVAVALVSTPQFGPRLAEFEDRTKWNAGQFRRRFSGRWAALPGKTDETDLAALAEKAMPHVGSKGLVQKQLTID